MAQTLFVWPDRKADAASSSRLCEAGLKSDLTQDRYSNTLACHGQLTLRVHKKRRFGKEKNVNGYGDAARQRHGDTGTSRNERFAMCLCRTDPQTRRGRTAFVVWIMWKTAQG